MLCNNYAVPLYEDPAFTTPTSNDCRPSRNRFVEIVYNQDNGLSLHLRRIADVHNIIAPASGRKINSGRGLSHSFSPGVARKTGVGSGSNFSSSVLVRLKTNKGAGERSVLLSMFADVVKFCSVLQALKISICTPPRTEAHSPPKIEGG